MCGGSRSRTTSSNATAAGLLVSASSDLVYQPARGAIFETGSAQLIADQELSFVVRAGNELAIFERRPGTWRDELLRRERHRW